MMRASARGHNAMAQQTPPTTRSGILAHAEDDEVAHRRIADHLANAAVRLLVSARQASARSITRA
jgi:hypothetical protein